MNESVKISGRREGNRSEEPSLGEKHSSLLSFYTRLSAVIHLHHELSTRTPLRYRETILCHHFIGWVGLRRDNHLAPYYNGVQ